MLLRKPLFLGFIMGFAGVLSFSGQAGAQDRLAEAIPVGKVQIIWPQLEASQKTMVDLVAADFFQNELSDAQRQRIIGTDAAHYRSSTGDDREALRTGRGQEWQARSESGDATASAPYDRLSDRQKAPFRRYAIDQLGLAMPVEQPSGAAGRNTV
jgi:hypothetical protein